MSSTNKAKSLSINKSSSSIPHVAKKAKSLSFNKLQFNNIWFRYNEEMDYVFQDKTLEINCTDHKIIGITGESGKGKSYILKIYILSRLRYTIE